MVGSLIKKFLPEEKIEKIRRFKNLQKKSIIALKENNIIPSMTVQIGQTAFTISYISEIPMQQWKKIVADFNSLKSLSEREHATVSLAEAICREPRFIDIISQPYVRSLITNEELHANLFGTALYVNGNLQDAYQCFSENARKYPTPLNYLFAYRTAVLLDPKEETAIQLIKESLDKNPGNSALQLCLASSYYRTFRTKEANGVLNTIDPAFKESVRTYDIAGTSSKNLPAFDEELRNALEHKLLERPKTDESKVGDYYNEESAGAYWNILYYSFNFLNRYQHGWGNLAYMIEHVMERMIKDHSEIKNVIDFGTFCASPLYKLSVKFPNIKFFGLDREKSTKSLNDAAYQDHNLEFIAGDILDVLPKLPIRDNSLLFHSRTATLIYPEQLKLIYKACAQNGIKYIATYENIALSRTEMQYFDFDNMPKEAVPYGSVMIIHNYKKYLEEAGYEILEEMRHSYADLLWNGKEQLLGDAHGTIIARLK